MSKKNGRLTTAAVIDIGANALRLKIVQSKQRQIDVLEDLRYPLSLGRDTFTVGKISFEKANKACEIIKNYLSVIKEYDVLDVRAVATTALREASNKDYILDQINFKTGLTVSILDDWEEKNHIYHQMSRIINESNMFKKAGLMAYIGSGSIGISIYDNGFVPFTQSIKIGSLRLTEILETVQDYTEQFYLLLEEYICSFTDILNNLLPQIPIHNLFASGREISLIATLCNAEFENEFAYIDVTSFNELYDYVKYKTVDQLMQEYNLPEDKAEVLLPAMSIFKVLAGYTKTGKIVVPLVFLRDAILFEMLFQGESFKISKVFAENTLISARTLAEKYMYDEEHSKRVERFALKIFDKMKKIHALSSRERLLLQVASILHDIGKFINIKKHYKHSYNIITGSDIIGLNFKEIEIVASVARYHSQVVPNKKSRHFKSLSNKQKNIISKLTAILRVADALDRSHLQKFDDIDVKIVGNVLFVEITTFKNTQIEEWSFINKGQYFQDVFGIKLFIKKKVM